MRAFFYVTRGVETYYYSREAEEEEVPYANPGNPHMTELSNYPDPKNQAKVELTNRILASIREHYHLIETAEEFKIAMALKDQCEVKFDIADHTPSEAP